MPITKKSKKTPTVGEERTGFFEALDSTVFEEGATEKAWALIQEQERMMELRKKWLIVQEVWALKKGYPFVKAFQIEWNEDRESCSVPSQPGDMEMDLDELSFFLKNEGGGPLEQIVRKRMAEDIRQNGFEEETVATYMFADDVDSCRWSWSFWAHEFATAKTIDFTSLEALARGVLSPEDWAAWEVRGLKSIMESADAPVLRNQGAGQGMAATEQAAVRQKRL